MEFTLHLTIVNPETGEEHVETIASFDKSNEHLEDLGLSLEESKDTLKSLQEAIVNKQVEECISERSHCPCCGKPLRKKENGELVFRTLFGDLHLPSPRFYQCVCSQEKSKTITPLRELLTENTSPERLYMETKWASLLSFGQTVNLLKDVLPIGEKLNAASVRNHLKKMALRHEEELMEEPEVDFAEYRRKKQETAFSDRREPFT